MEEKSFDKVLVKCVEQEFLDIFGEIGSRVLYYYLWKSFSTNVTKPRNFSEVLHEFLGSGALPIERTILRRLYNELGLELKEKEGYAFTQYIEEARKAYDRK